MDRRQFLKALGMGVVGSGILTGQAMANTKGAAAASKLKTHQVKETATICAYCGVGCGIILYSKDEQILFGEGDPDHPISQGTLCLKGSSIGEIHTQVLAKRKRGPNQQRVTKPLYRAPGSAEWVEKDWDWMLSNLAQRIKKTRDETFETTDQRGTTVNRTLALASFGSASLDNEEAYLLNKLMRSLGLINIEHHARI